MSVTEGIRQVKADRSRPTSSAWPARDRGGLLLLLDALGRLAGAIGGDNP